MTGERKNRGYMHMPPPGMVIVLPSLMQVGGNAGIQSLVAVKVPRCFLYASHIG